MFKDRFWIIQTVLRWRQNTLQISIFYVLIAREPISAHLW
ncbi:hypothetical protein ASD8599_03131 [Ascidiaceihabitans donghaensis]|uniref:Uncharacterized protein n=1 Tax=Ascidiaceihabitans donghaensis TaxID=1510460 RepID=A0A2R8BH92_9RHOB|nr:hypothetical protein ASD8599_03131 [Ascidiaceihabitans donghaensis]